MDEKTAVSSRMKGRARKPKQQPHNDQSQETTVESDQSTNPATAGADATADTEPASGSDDKKGKKTGEKREPKVSALRMLSIPTSVERVQPTCSQTCGTGV